ncbi:DUF4336 domain-containing protein [Maritimibacter fusiformis]|uniref:DUF4336 domain-containing protein n=1 Tax=Maritimibacter fusiformis TaxID=2603819 RepID=A0A5D0RN30_9RHOB|nr:DUF4336 domain-containing protein [Maritimibacter fusiformis]TYB82356.1 DUF4336 domain-containing protein [Maritimibacter fusiformis]
MLKSFGPDIWLADGATVSVAGFRYPTRMAVIRPPDAGLLIWSPVALTGALRAEVDMLGKVCHIVAPNSLHHLFVPDWAAAWPDALIHAAPGLRGKRPDIAFHAELGDTPDPGWAGVVDQVVIPGNRITTEVLFFHRPSATVLVTDLIQHFPKGWHKGWRAVVARLDLMVAPEPSVPRKFRLAFTDRRAARVAVARVLDWPAERLVMAHGAPVERGGGEVLARAFGWLGR